jgi:hypothetical protein
MGEGVLLLQGMDSERGGVGLSLSSIKKFGQRLICIDWKDDDANDNFAFFISMGGKSTWACALLTSKIQAIIIFSKPKKTHG